MRYYAVAFVFYEHVGDEKPTISNIAFFAAETERIALEMADANIAKIYGDLYARFPDGKYLKMVKEISAALINDMKGQPEASAEAIEDILTADEIC